MPTQKTRLLNFFPETEEEIFKILQEETGKSREALKVITAFQFIYARDMIRNGSHRAILLHNLGSFETYLSSTNREIRKAITAYRKGNISRGKAVSAISKLWKLRVACQEQAMRMLDK